MASPARDLVFISYAHEDATWLERLQKFLKPYVRQGRLEVWQDAYIKVGERWERKITQALERTAVGVLLVSQDLLASDFVMDEELPALRAAEEAGLLTLFCIPISASTHEATDLGAFQWARDPDEPLDELEPSKRNRALVEITKELVAAAAVRAPGVELLTATPVVVPRDPVAPIMAAPSVLPGALRGVPELPPHYLPRPENLDRLRGALLGGTDSAMGITGVSYKLGLQGQGGIGKSVLAAALARDEEVRRAFPDGIYWITLGQEPDLLRVQSDLLRRLGADEGGVTSTENGRRALGEILDTRSCLLVVDDAWDTGHARVFDAVGSRSRLVVTTRDATILTALGAREQRIDRLPEALAVELLANWSERQSGPHPEETKRVAQECGYIPLALAVAGARVRDGLAWADLLDALEHGRLEFLDHPYASVFRSMRLGVDALSPHDRERYLELAVFPEDVRVPEPVVLRLWRKTAGLDPTEAKALLASFERKALLERSLTDAGREISFHDLQHDFVRILADDLPALHEQLLSALAEGIADSERNTPAWWALPEGDTYPWIYVASHLLGAGRIDEVRALLLDFRWLEAKLHTRGITALLSDIDLFSGDEDLSLLAAALRMSAHVLASKTDQLASQLTGRLLGVEKQRIRALIDSARPSSGKPRLRLLSGSLVEPMGGLLRTLHGHPDSVNAVAVSPDGGYAISGSSDNTLKLWNLQTGEEIQILRGHTGWVQAVAFSPDGRWAVSGAFDNTVRIWDLESSQAVRTFRGHSSTVSAVTVTSDGKLLITGSWDRTLKVWNVDRGVELFTLDGHKDAVTSLAVCRNGKQIVSGAWDKTVKIWDLDGKKEVRTLVGHTDHVNAVAATADGRYVVSGSSDQTVRVWDVQSGRPVRIIDAGGAVYSIAVTPDGQRVLAGSAGLLRVWDLESGRSAQVLQGHGNTVSSITLTLDGRLAVTGSWDHTLRVWEIGTCGKTRVPQGHTGRVRAIAIASDGRFAISASSDRSLKMWSLQSRREVRTFEGHTDAVSDVAISRDGTWAVSASWDGTLKSWDLESGREIRTFAGHEGQVHTVAITADGGHIVSGADDQTIRVWDARSGGSLHVLAGHSRAVESVSISPDGEHVLSGSSDHTVRVWSLKDHREISSLVGHSRGVTTVEVDCEGSFAISGSHDRTVRIWDLETYSEVETLVLDQGPVFAATVSPDGRNIIIGCYDTTLHVWNRKRNAPLASFNADGLISSCAVTPDGKMIVAGDGTGRVHFLELEHADSDQAD